MSAYCAPCRRLFKEQRELDQHIQDSSAHKQPTQRPSQDDTTNNPAYCALCRRSFKGQKDLDRHIQTSLAHKQPTQRSSQEHGTSIQPFTDNKSAYCAVCRRSFKGQEPLEQHIRTSTAHKKPTLSQVNPAEPPHFLTGTERKHAQPPNAIASSSSAPQITKSASKTVPLAAKSRWSVTPKSKSTAVLDALSAHCHPPSELEKNNFIVNPYNPLDYVNLRKCKRCKSQETKVDGRACTFHSSKHNKWNQNRPYKCCNTKGGPGGGCLTLPSHDFQLPLRANNHIDYRQTPAASEKPKSRAVAFDCEMAGIAGGAGEVIMLCATDYVTGAVLLNRYVNPSEKITQMRTSIHGISKSTLDDAISEGQALSGWKAARSELWKCIDDKTILVGHALEHDLDGLRMIHPRVVDSGILSRNEVGLHFKWGLQTLCSELLNVEIRKNKGAIHDCLEDVLATREVVLFCTQNKEAFRNWGEAKKGEEMRLKKEREIARKEKASKKAKTDKAKVQGGSNRYTSFDSDDEDDEVLRWSDIAEDMGWPHPDTGYDPWSD